MKNKVLGTQLSKNTAIRNNSNKAGSGCEIVYIVTSYDRNWVFLTKYKWDPQNISTCGQLANPKDQFYPSTLRSVFSAINLLLTIDVYQKLQPLNSFRRVATIVFLRAE